MDTKEAGAKRRRWSLEVKRQLVAEDAGAGLVGVDRGQKARRQRQPAVQMAARAGGIDARWGGAGTGCGDARAGHGAGGAEARTGPDRDRALGWGQGEVLGAVDPAAVSAAMAAVLKARRRPTPRGKPRGDPER